MESTRQELLRNATATVRRAGSAALNFRDLGHSVGVKSSTVHYYFPTKSDLLNEAAAEYTTAMVAALKDGARTSKSFRQDMLVWSICSSAPRARSCPACAACWPPRPTCSTPP